jgi:RHS repeat-associated protein
MEEYVNDANGVVCTIDYDYRDWGGYELGWHLKDHLGSTVAVVAEPVLSVPPENPQRVGQRILWTGNYESFGRPDNNVPVCPGAWENPIQFTGYYSDGDVFEHYYAKARYYDPYTGRFLSRDPDRFEFDQAPTTANRYPYCANNPVHFVDPTGRFFFLPFFLLGIDLGIATVAEAIILDAVLAMVTAPVFDPSMSGTDVFLAGVSQAVTDVTLFLGAGWGTLTGGWVAEAGKELLGTQMATNICLGLNWATQTILNVSNAGGRWGPKYHPIPHAIHHGFLGAVTGGLLGGWSGFASVVGTLVSFDDFFQHLGQIVTNDPSFHTPIHQIWGNEGMKWGLLGGAGAIIAAEALLWWFL